MLRRLKSIEINQVLKENYNIWSPGLGRARYGHYQWWQLNSPWGRRNIEYFGYFTKAEGLVASCKRYHLVYQAGGKTFQVAGIGAVFVPESKRGKSYGLALLEQLANLSRKEGFDAMLLNSDIDPSYYERLGYHLFAAEAFKISLTEKWLGSAIKQLEARTDKDLDESIVVRSIQLTDFDEICRHHKRWLSAQDFGLKRSPDYMRYKLGRELYLYEHSSLNWPKLDLITDNFGKFAGGYALIEQSGPYLRALEVIGPERIRNTLWAQILRLAQRREAKTLRAWQAIHPDLKGLTTYDRDWSFPMICPLKKELAAIFLSWLTVDPPPLLELDHF